MFKSILSIAFCLGISFTSRCQVNDNGSTPRPEKIYTKVEKQAEFNGGAAGWRTFLSNNLNVSVPKTNGAPVGSYTVIVKAVISRSGNVGTVVAETNFGFGMEAEAIRVMKLTSNWTPAMNSGHPVASYFRQPVTFIVP